MANQPYNNLTPSGSQEWHIDRRSNRRTRCMSWVDYALIAAAVVLFVALNLVLLSVFMAG